MVTNQVPELMDVTLQGVEVIGEELGKGAYGRVYTVRYGGTIYAAKEIHSILITTVSSDDSKLMKRNFIKECLCCRNIYHPNVVEFVGVYYADGAAIPNMVMELMDTSLTSFIENNQKICTAAKASIMLDVSRGLMYLHTHNPPIVHRDLSSNNVMLTSKLTAKIGDLGVAKVLDSNRGLSFRHSKSKLTTAPGCVDFMPPETLTDFPVYSFPVDVFSFAAIVLHLFSEKWPRPSFPKRTNIETNQLEAISEAARCKAYLDVMVGEESVIVMWQLAERCLNDSPTKRPPIQEVNKIVKDLLVSTLTLKPA